VYVCVCVIECVCVGGWGADVDANERGRATFHTTASSVAPLC
jgi:hypothetical protein